MANSKQFIWCFGLGFSLMLATSMVTADDRRKSDPKLSKEPRSSPSDKPTTMSRPPKSSKEQRSSSADKPATMYRPPKLGKPIATTGGGSRGQDVPTPFVLAPQHVALTAQDQADLYWYLPGLTTHSIILTIIDYEGKEDQPLWEQALRPPTRPGVQRIQLSELGVRLKHGVSYEWTIAISPNLEKRSLDSIARGGIEYRQLPGSLKTEIEQVSRTQVPSLYARAGYWYDALSALSSLIVRSSPDAALWKQRRAALLQEAALPENVVQGSLQHSD